MKKRDRRQTPLDASLVQGKSNKQSSLLDSLTSIDAISPDETPIMLNAKAYEFSLTL